ncbi:hypothetical protein PBAL39_25640, partial [Pedobacter sp. BAL39]|uniref:hypothetical protein n=1 Tax=Pedobacter sp. BAL39 TaxID=391596 RepID=UPI000155972F
FLASCGTSTHLLNSWIAPENKTQQYKKVLVIGLIGPRDRDLREIIENTMVQSLKAQGINAGSAYAEYGPKAFEDLKEQEALKKISDKGYDGAFTIALLDKKKERYYSPGYVGFAPYPFGFWGYYRNMWGRMYQPGYYNVSTNYMLEGNFYDLNPDKHIYSAQTRTFDPSSAENLSSDFSKTVVADMMNKGLLKR